MSQTKSASMLLERMIDAIYSIQEYTKDCTFEQFTNNKEKRDACLMQFVHIGEIITTLGKHYPQIATLPSKEAIGLRNIIAHNYHGVDIELIWNLIKQILPSLLEQIQKELSNQ